MLEWLHQCALLLVYLTALTTLEVNQTATASAASDKSAVAPQHPTRTAAAKRPHWAYQPVRNPMPPCVREQERVETPIDAFVAAALERKGLCLSPPADRRTLIRRAYFDLVGLPATFEETEAFVQDTSPDAFAKVVDRLLASPRYGERWGRHWLDVARFAETKDLVLLFGKDRLQPYAYTYRDYVIRAFNEDIPYDEFVREQLAADQIEPKVEPWRLAALGFLTVGRLYDNNRNDQIDDQIDVTTRGFLGLTVACARCHNHKYDAIPTEDYYSLYGVFASSERPYDLPLIEDPDRVPGGPDFEKKLADARAKLQQHIDTQYELLKEAARTRIEDYLVRVATTKPDISETSTFFLSLSPEDLRPGLVLQWRRYLEQRARKNDAVFGLWNQLLELADDQFAEKSRPVLEASRSTALNPLVLKAFDSATLTNRAEVAHRYGKLLRETYERSKKDHLSADEEQLLAVLTAKDSPCSFPKSSTPQHMSRVEKDKFGGLVLELDKLAAYATNRPPARAMVVRDTPELYNPHVFVRGSPARLGQAVPRRFLRVLAGEQREPFAHGSGRLDLANAITAPDNPLTSRVLVNRVWMHHFGEPLVNSPSDFGTRSDPPSNPELLDYLAWTFVHEGWSLKKLHRLIMLSSVYQQASQDRPEASKVDPDNRLLWRANRRRLEFEAMRDTLLETSARLDTTMGGRSVDVAGDALNRRRTVYGLVDRQDLPAVFRAFDFACPDQSVERRPRTIVPQQALFAMNAPFVLEQAKALASQVQPLVGTLSAEPSGTVGSNAPESAPGPAGSFGPAVCKLYELVLARAPDRTELDEAVQFLNAVQGEQGARIDGTAPALAQFAQVLLMSNELMFID